MSALLPEGVHHLADLPFTLHDAIVAGLGFLQLEELPSDERPPRNIWLDPKAMRKHWKEVERKREEKYNPKKGIDDVPGGEVRHNPAVDDILAD